MSFRDLASRLELSPFELARAMGKSEGLPSILRFGEADVDRIRVRVGLTEWWPNGLIPVEDHVKGRALVRSLAQKLSAFQREGGASTRADNLFRGLEGEEQLLVRRAVNLFHQNGLIDRLSRTDGLYVSVDTLQVSSLEQIAAGTAFPENIQKLWA